MLTSSLKGKPTIEDAANDNELGFRQIPEFLPLLRDCQLRLNTSQGESEECQLAALLFTLGAKRSDRYQVMAQYLAKYLMGRIPLSVQDLNHFSGLNLTNFDMFINFDFQPRDALARITYELYKYMFYPVEFHPDGTYSLKKMTDFTMKSVEPPLNTIPVGTFVTLLLQLMNNRPR